MKKNKYPTMKDILRITNENKYHEKDAVRFKYVIQKVKRPCIEIILNDKTIDYIYHCTLANNHTICLYGDWIFDPALPYTYKRTLSNFVKLQRHVMVERLRHYSNCVTNTLYHILRIRKMWHSLRSNITVDDVEKYEEHLLESGCSAGLEEQNGRRGMRYT